MSASTRRRPSPSARSSRSRSRRSSPVRRKPEQSSNRVIGQSGNRVIGQSSNAVALIALGVTDGMGAYKAVEVVRGLQKRGHDVVAVMTANATRFVGPITFEAITRRPVITDQFSPGTNADIEHIALASSIGLLLVAPV